MDIELRDNADENRYEAVVDGQVAAYIVYRDRYDGARVYLHTETDPAFAGKGVASSLVRQALEAERARPRRVVPSCPFVAAFLERHPDYKDVTTL
ncbi:GNAT family N-acetyltransferase [Rugosimonospora acidiphila]|uniref:GNAT family N-acetyltransferase n=1 Tax=Rugosimonospora acidiphila TaxID=556531 RepID=A0ABP9RXU3_9ACTN